MAGWVKQGSLRGPAGPRGESVLALGPDAPQSPKDGDAWLETDAEGDLVSIATWRDAGTYPSGATYPGPGTVPSHDGWNHNETEVQ